MKQDMDTQKHTKSPTELNRYPPTRVWTVVVAIHTEHRDE